MRRRVVALVASFALCTPSLVMAAEGSIEPFLRSGPSLPPDSGVSVGLRAAFGIPMGSSSEGNSLSDSISSAVPLHVDLGYRFNPNLYLGAFFQYAFASLASAAKAACAPASCSASDIRFGADVIYSFTPAAKLSPWAGIGLGYEIGKITASAGGTNADVTFKGFEFAHLGLGLDYRVSARFRAGPFATISLAQYSSFEAASQSVDLPKAMHEWLQLGIKGTFDF